MDLAEPGPTPLSAAKMRADVRIPRNHRNSEAEIVLLLIQTRSTQRTGTSEVARGIFALYAADFGAFILNEMVAVDTDTGISFPGYVVSLELSDGRACGRQT